jgi:hypothetical protein
MALWENAIESVGKSWTSNVLIGAAAVMLAPIVVPTVLAGMRPLSKAAVKGGILIYDKARELVAETGEQLNDLMAEARSELAATAATATAAQTASTSSQEQACETAPPPAREGTKDPETEA